MQSIQSKTARTWDSFAVTLEKVLSLLQPKRIFEYGPGESTKIMSKFPTVISIDSVEHDKAWFGKWQWSLPDNVNLIYNPVMELYPETQGRYDRYDLIFVDGREREKCIFVARGRLNENGVIMLHDAERVQYKEIIDSFKFRFFTDDGHTATLTDNQTVASMLERLYD